MKGRPRAGLWVLGWLLLGCADAAPAGRGAPWPAADALFHRGPRFLGADGAYSVPLRDGRVLWLFGDTSVARTAGRTDDAFFVRNTIAVQTGADPATAFIRHYWAWDGGEARSYFPDPAEGRWLWPMHGVDLGGRLLLFMERLRQDGAPGPWAFADTGSVAVLIDDPADPPEAWRQTTVELPADLAGALVGEAVLRVDDWLYLYGTRGDRHAVFLVRVPVEAARAGDLSRVERYCGGAFRPDCAPDTLIAWGAPEFSVHFEPALDAYVFVYSAGFGPTTIAWRTAPAPEGPWSAPTDVFRPPESFAEGAFVYAAKAHPALETPGGLAVTYVPSSFGETPPDLQDRYYFPHFVRVWPK